MKNIERKNVIESIPCNRKVEVVKNITQLAKLTCESHLLPKARVFALQNELKHNFNYQVCKNSVQYLTLYCQYLKKLKQMLSNQSKDSVKEQSYLTQFSRSHFEDHVSKLFLGIDSINKKLKSGSIQFSKLCLISYFQLEQFNQDDLIPFLLKKINQAKIDRLIDYEEVRGKRSKKSFLHYQQKQNKIKIPLVSQSRRIIGEKFSKIHFEILTLKIMLSNVSPDPVQTNKICEKIKVDLQNLFKKIKLKPTMNQHNIRIKTIFQQN